MRRALSMLGIGTVVGCATVPATEPLVSDRPDFTESASALEPGRVQVEGGWTYEDADGSSRHAIGELLARIGVVSGLEARLGLNSVAVVEVAGERESAVEDASIGAKLELSGEAALLAGTTLPTGQSPLGGEVAVPGVTLALARDLSESVSVGANLLAEWPEDGLGDRYTDLGASVAFGIGLTERTGLFVEAFGFRAPARGGGSRQYFDGGLTHLLSDDLQLDARVGGGEGVWFVGVGVVRRW